MESEEPGANDRVTQRPRERRQIPVMIALALVTVMTTVFILRSGSNPVGAVTGNLPGRIKETPPPDIDSAGYRRIIISIDSARLALGARYKAARSPSERAEILDQAADALRNVVVERLVPVWVGTAWEFYGTSQIPQKGAIACGYFVTTLLRDAGMKLNRVRLAQLASEAIIKSLIGREHIQRFSNVTLPHFVEAVRRSGRGLYIVGLDNHVGLIAHTGEEVLFIHSSYVSPGSVVIEQAALSPVLASLRYRVIGSLTGDRDVVKSWLLGEAQ